MELAPLIMWYRAGIGIAIVQVGIRKILLSCCRIFPLRDWISDPGWGNPVATVRKRSFLPFFHSLDVLRGSAPFEMQILKKLQTL